MLISPSDPDQIIQKNEDGKFALIDKDDVDDPLTPSMNSNAVLGANRHKVENFHGKFFSLI